MVVIFPTVNFLIQLRAKNSSGVRLDPPLPPPWLQKNKGGGIILPPNLLRVKSQSNLKNNAIIGFPGSKTPQIEWSKFPRVHFVQKMKIIRKKMSYLHAFYEKTAQYIFLRFCQNVHFVKILDKSYERFFCKIPKTKKKKSCFFLQKKINK